MGIKISKKHKIDIKELRFEKRTCTFLVTPHSTEAELSKTTSVYTMKPKAGGTLHHERNEQDRKCKNETKDGRNLSVLTETSM